MAVFSSSIRRGGLTAALVFAVMLAVTAICFAGVGSAFADNKNLDAPTTVSDDITRLHVSKLDADTHEFVEGATMSIIEKDTGVVVDEWVSGSGVHVNEKGLDVETTYILREMAAPDNYSVAKDTEFIINEIEGEGVTILTGPDAELTESYKINLYDKAKDTEVVDTVEKPSGSTSSGKASTTPAPKTGDETPLWPIAILVGAGVVAIVVLQLFKRRLAK